MEPDSNQSLIAEIRHKLSIWQNVYNRSQSNKQTAINSQTKQSDLDTIKAYKRRLIDILSEARGPDFRTPALISGVGFLGGVGALILDVTFTGGLLTAISVSGFLATGEMSQRRYVELAQYRLLIRDLSRMKQMIEDY